MRFQRSRTQILFRYIPGALFEHDKYGICIVTDIAVTAPDNINEDGLKNALFSHLDRWDALDVFPDPFDEWSEYKVGVPDRISFDAFPPVVECNKCGHINNLSTLAKLPLGHDTTCTNCKQGKYRQLAYASIHYCGRISALPTLGCPTHGYDHMVFVDTGRFVTAYWKCAKCGWNNTLPMYQCNCGYSRTLNSDEYYKRALRFVRTNDTSVIYSHVLPIVNISGNLQEKLHHDTKAHALLLGKYWGLINENISIVLDERQKMSSKSEADDQMQKLLQELLLESPDNPKLQEALSIREKETHLPYEDEVVTIESHFPNISLRSPSQALLEYVAIRDTLDIITLEEVKLATQERGDSIGLYDIEQATEFSSNELGIKEIVCITDFPIALIAIGYTRGSKNPGDATLTPFRPNRSMDGKVPLYAVTSNTEAIMLQLDPLKLVKWLIMNDFASGQSVSSEADASIWCKQNMPHLSDFRGLIDAPEHINLAEKATLTLMHTISHLMMEHIEWSGFDPESVGEYILPETLAIIIHSNNYNSFTIGGMVTLFEQRLYGWLRDAYNSAFTCIYNPICDDEGGSCSGCLHRQYNCENFNHYLSRLILQGGYIPELQANVKYGYWMIND